jgi:hypothetical protein
MNWFRRKADPISDRTRALSSEIAALEAQIRQYEVTLREGSSHEPVTRSSSVRAQASSPAVPASGTVRGEIELEDLALARAGRVEPVVAAPANEMGVRKYDLPALVNRLRGQFRPATTSNPQLVHYLAAGGIQGLRPLRYEKRIARNRFLLLFGIFFLVLLGILSVFLRQQ